MADNPLSPETIAWGCSYTPAEVGPGQSYWQLAEARGPYEWGGRISIFVEVLGADGQRVVGTRVRLFNGGNAFKATEPKPGDDFAVDFPMYAKGNAYGVQMADGLPSDTIFGFGLKEYAPHQVFHLTYRLIVADEQPPTEPPSQGMSIRDALIQAQGYINYALGQLP